MALFIGNYGRALSAAVLLGGVLSATMSTGPLAQEPVAQAAKPTAETSMTPEEVARETLRSETRIRRLHDRLEITAAEETLWAPIAQIMRENALALRVSVSHDKASMKLATAVNDLKTFQIIAEQHSSGLKKLIPAFTTLYDSMPPAQQKRANTVFGRHSREGRM